jgi:hypothetical protein
MALRFVQNNMANTVWFRNGEQSRDNRVIPSGEGRDTGGAWFPWCWEEAQFITHHFEIFNPDEERVLWYIWERDAVIRASQTGFESPGTPISGDAGTDGDRNITVNSGGDLNCYKPKTP